MSDFPRRSTEWVTFVARTLVLLTGAALIVAVVIEFFRDDEVSTAALIVGAVLLVLPLVVDRLEKFSVTPQGFDFEFTQQVANLGAPKTAGLLEQTGMARDLETYAFVYNELTDPDLLPYRKRLLDKLVAEATSAATTHRFDAEEVHKLFYAGSPVMRVLALGLMEGDPSLLSPDILRSAIAESRTGNEQYHGLKLAERAWPRLSQPTRTELSALIRSDVHIHEDPDRTRLAQRILARPVTN
ncbi:hypothetical protein FB561_4231 [Kribbella amoyensis]|uniref:Uncharacterized protein n=1 Tax=Kribbella amoyensis TaxID=996641 RepID=A0A561BW11_9ACTN|nr:hypothetical protein [Kribbella amoyensis]TWD83076.1 hypothetical protein FB561_4231 [Kribbella amoyensis]